jgi:hypothetical protein
MLVTVLQRERKEREGGRKEGRVGEREGGS